MGAFEKISKRLLAVHKTPGFRERSPEEHDQYMEQFQRYAQGIGAETQANLFAELYALARKFNRLVFYEVRPDAIEVVSTTKLKYLPEGPPNLIRRPWLIETKLPDQQHLFGQTVCLAGYPVSDNEYMLIGSEYPENIFVTTWKPQWADNEVLGAEFDGPMIEYYEEWLGQAVEFLLVFGLLLDTEYSPIEIVQTLTPRPKSKSPKPTKKKWYKPQVDYSIRYISLSERGKKLYDQSELEKSGYTRDHLQAIKGMVRGHIRQQPYGPERKLRKPIYVSPYEQTKYIDPLKPLKKITTR